MKNLTIETIHRNGIAVDVDTYTGEVLSVTDVATGQPARQFHSAYVIATVTRYAQESILSLAELG